MEEEEEEEGADRLKQSTRGCCECATRGAASLSRSRTLCTVPFTLNSPFLSCSLLTGCFVVVFLLKDGLSGAPGRRNRGDTEEGERESEEEAGGGAGEAQRRGV